MSVQNLRNKFNQNNSAVPYNPPGLSYSKPQSNNNQIPSYQQNGMERFTTITEEPETAEKPAIKNNSFLQSYIAGDMAKNGASVNGKTNITPVKKFTTSRCADVTNVASSRTTGKCSPAAETAPKSGTAKFNMTSSAHTVSSNFAYPKSPPPPPPSSSAENAAVSRYAVKSPPPMPSDPSSVAKFPIKPSVVLRNGLAKTTVNDDDKWKCKYDETEIKRKSLLTQSQKLLMEKSDMERQMKNLRSDLQTSNKELAERDLQLSQLRKLSEAMYKEYDQLKKQYELETGTLQKAMERASEWYKQNRELKRRSSALMQKVISVAPNTLDDLMVDTTDGNDNDTEMEELRKTVKELTQEISRLQAELNKIKLQEFEAQEQTVDLTSELEEERRARKRAEQQLKELTMKHDNLESVSRKVLEETTVLHERYKKEKEEGNKIRTDANKVKSERDVLARQSQLLMMDAASDEKIMKLLFEIEHLQRTLSQERQEHVEQLKDLQEKLESQSDSEQIELYEEKLKLTEAELLCSRQRAEIAESQVEELRKRLNDVKSSQPSCAPPQPPPMPCAPPPPPPPPPASMPPAPPPPPPMAFTQNMKSVKLRTVNALNPTEGDAIKEMGNYLGMDSVPKTPQVQNGAIDAIINQIKGGRFNLKSTGKETPVKRQESPPVVNEMMNVLGTLRRNPKRRASFKTAPADVAL